MQNQHYDKPEDERLERAGRSVTEIKGNEGGLERENMKEVLVLGMHGIGL